MKSSTRGKAEGELHEVKGKVKKVAKLASDVNGVTSVENRMTIE